MKVLFLGTGAGGGVPQWNCNCAYCQRTRQGELSPRMEAAIALSADEQRWVLVDAPLDLPMMFNRYPDLFPPAGNIRGCPVRCVVLTHGDLNHSAGILVFRGPITETRPYVSIYATQRVREVLWDENPVFHIVRAKWTILQPDAWVDLQTPEGEPTGLEVRAILVPGKPPTYRYQPHPENTIAAQFRERATGRTLLYAPVVREINDALQQAMESSDVVVFDGTFWTNDEFQDLDPGHRTAVQIGHMPVEQSWPILAQLPAQHRIYTQINNTNPLNDPRSEAYQTITSAGITVAQDGWQFSI